MGLLVLKFGGTSVATVPAIENVANKVAAEIKLGHKVAVVVSAMAGVTNQLVSYCTAINTLYDPREYDAIVASGEQVTSGLLALALHKRGLAARSWQGWQVPILTNDVHGKARIRGIETDNLRASLERGEVAVIAGFQGMAGDNRIATLGRGGSDTSAVAVAAALKADRCDIYTDVDGVYTADPRIVTKAKKIPKISYEEMLEMASVGAKVLQTRSVELAMKEKVPVQVLSSFEGALGSDIPGTMVIDEDNIVEQEVVSGVTHSRDEAKVTLRNLPDVPGVAAKIFGGMAEAAVNVDMIVQNVSPDKAKTDLTFTVGRADLPKALDILKKAENDGLKGIQVESSADVAKVSIIGIGMKSYVGVASKMFQTLADKGINIQVITTSEIKVSVLISEEYTELAVRSLHTAYGLDQA
ncbi:MAG TPA: aspartate kinase [Patescibacteria group bacterium]|nr:aspartate kinase [Patescibacteria group bacterium]